MAFAIVNGGGNVGHASLASAFCVEFEGCAEQCAAWIFVDS